MNRNYDSTAYNNLSFLPEFDSFIKIISKFMTAGRCTELVHKNCYVDS